MYRPDRLCCLLPRVEAFVAHEARDDGLPWLRNTRRTPCVWKQAGPWRYADANVDFMRPCRRADGSDLWLSCRAGAQEGR